MKKGEQPSKKEVTKLGAKESTAYRCPMHPEVTSDKPGKCGKCGMALKSVAPMDLYTCPMHPEVTSDKPGKCSKCGMALKSTAPTNLYTCPMHPEVTSDKPGACSKCGMDLVKKEPKSSLMKMKKSKDEVDAEGNYNCCIKPACEECYEGHGDCNCYQAVKRGKSVCGECGAGWKKGKGRVSGINADSVKSSSHKH